MHFSRQLICNRVLSYRLQLSMVYLNCTREAGVYTTRQKLSCFNLCLKQINHDKGHSLSGLCTMCFNEYNQPVVYDSYTEKGSYTELDPLSLGLLDVCGFQDVKEVYRTICMNSEINHQQYLVFNNIKDDQAKNVSRVVVEHTGIC